MHRLLKRQLRKAFPDGVPEKGDTLDAKQLQKFIELVNQGYQSMAEQLTITERSLDLSCTELTKRNNTLSLILDALPDMSFWIDKEGLVRDIRPGNFPSSFISSEENFKELEEVSIVKSSPELANFLKSYQTKDKYVAELNLYANQTQYQVKARLTAISHNRWLLVLRDISLSKQLEMLQKQRLEQIQKAQKQLQGLVNAAPMGIVICNPNQEIIMVNQYISHVFDKPKREFLGLNPSELVSSKHHLTLQANINDVLLNQEEEYNRRLDIVLTLPSDEYMQAEIALSTLMFEDQLLLIMSISDISERKQLEKQLRILAATDPLTGAYNRRSFNDFTERAIGTCQHMKSPLSLIILDIDFFKKINDTYGHAAGDEVLISVVEKISEVTRDTDILGRLGGEEFAVALPNATLELANDVAERIREGIENMVVTNGTQNIRLTVSLGVVTLTDSMLNNPLEMAINSADEYLYFAKEHGRNRVINSEQYTKLTS
ncbi:sensor domain-containing diguanylate cyclase [Vibrio nigripulchritudo]|uniref:sensor domain-containing diguanylate cyclase n=1 Tax=Vibrio nigripulchritudo TaxID=28173 RepID=UPI0003B1EF7A|nr:sensor domain-containing diguanylate cyclase [Vibrio nigripulchritudo]CCN73378.1 putative PAS and GGDEF domains protein [Vibrio nigripulchritudo SFn118]